MVEAQRRTRIKRSIALLALLSACPAFGAPTKDPTGSAFVDSSLRLAEANWTAEVAKGSWFIEFVLPYSSSCKAFAPTWQELTSNKDTLRTLYPDAPFSLAQVDCSTERDICVREGVTHVPKLSLYRDGIQTEAEYTGEREYTALSALIDTEAASYRKSKGVSDEPHRAEAAAAPANQQPAEVQSPSLGGDKVAGPQPPPVAGPAAPPGRLEKGPAVNQAGPLPPPPAAAPPKEEAEQRKNPDSPVPAQPAQVPVQPLRPNPSGVMLQYGVDEAVKDESALHDFLSNDAAHGATFVKFFAPWCPHCSAMASAFQRLGDALKGQVNVVEVDCVANRAVCVSYSVQGFPTLRLFNEGESTEYNGSRTFEAMRTWALKAGSTSGVREIRSNELDDVSRNDEVFFLYLQEAGTPEEDIGAVTKASRVLLTTPVHVYRSSDPALIQRYGPHLSHGSSTHNSGSAAMALSGLLAFKDHDASSPTAVLHPSRQSNARDLAKDVGAWLNFHRFPTVIGMTGNTFNDVINNRQHAPVVLAAVSDVHHSGRRQGTGTGAAMRDEEVQSLRELALNWRRRAAGQLGTAKEDEKVLFAWIDADRWATAVGKYYDIKPIQLPRLLLAVGSRLEYYDLPSRFIDPYAAGRQAWLDADQVFDTLDQISQGKGPQPKSSRTYLDRSVRETASFIESTLLWVSHHTFLSLCLTIACIALLVSYLRHQASYMASHSQRLPPYGKVD